MRSPSPTLPLTLLLAVSLATLIPSTSPATPIAFHAPVNYASGAFPLRLVLADLNGDARLDVAVTNPDAFTDPRTVTVLFNAGDGTFLPAVAFPTGEVPRSIDAGDIDADGDVDLVVGYQVSDDRLGILRNNGSGAFAAPEFLAPVPGRADKVAVLDLDGDVDLDILIGQAGGDELVVVRNDGGTFAAPVTYGGTSSAYFLNMSVGDVDGDGDADVAVGRSLSVMPVASIYKNQGDGTFAPPVALAFVPFSYAGNDLGDVDADGDLDLAFVNDIGGQVLLARNVGAGTFVYGGEFPSVADTQLGSPLMLADLDGDGCADAVIPGANTYRVVTLRSAGATGFEVSQSHALGGIARKLEAGDLDNDGDVDVVGALSNDGKVSVLRNQLIDATGVIDVARNGAGLALGLVRPNPFRSAAAIPLDLSVATAVRLTVVDVQGRQVRTLLDEVVPGGRRVVSWDGRDDQGLDVAGGVYFMRLVAGTIRDGTRVVLVR